MMDEVTGKMICRQMRLRYAGYLAIAAAAGAVTVFAAVLTGKAVGWLDAATLFYLLILVGLAAWAAFLITDMVRVRQHRVFQRCGTPEQLAESITAGLRDPSFREREGEDFGLLVTEQFLVSSRNYGAYLELRDIRAVQRIVRCRRDENFEFVDAGSLPVSIGLSLGIFFTRTRIPADERSFTDQLCIWDADGKKHRYRINRTETESVLWLLRELVPDIEMKSTVQL